MIDLAQLDVGSPASYLIAVLVPALDALIPLLPSETAVIALGVATAGSADPRIAVLVALAAFGAFLGDNAAYLVGWRFGPAVSRRIFAGERGARRRAWAQRSLEEYGIRIIVACRFIPGGRTAVTLTCGLIGYPRRSFLLGTGLAGVLWASYAFFIGLGGQAFEGRPWAGLLVGLGLTLAVSGMIEAARRLRRRARAHRGARPADVPDPASRPDPDPDRDRCSAGGSGGSTSPAQVLQPDSTGAACTGPQDRRACSSPGTPPAGDSRAAPAGAWGAGAAWSGPSGAWPDAGVRAQPGTRPREDAAGSMLTVIPGPQAGRDRGDRQPASPAGRAYFPRPDPASSVSRRTACADAMSVVSPAAPSASSAVASARPHLAGSSACCLSTMAPFGRPRSRSRASATSSVCAPGNAAGTPFWRVPLAPADSAVTMSLIGSISLLGRVKPGQPDPGRHPGWAVAPAPARAASRCPGRPAARRPGRAVAWH